MDERALLGMVNGRDSPREAVAHLAAGLAAGDDVFSTSPAAPRQEMLGVGGARLSCSERDVCLDARTDGHRFVRHDAVPVGQSEYAERKRDAGVTGWKFGDEGDGVHYWPSDAPEASSNEMFMFHRDRVRVLGDDPLEHFDDWDSDDEDTWAEEVPIGAELQRILDHGEDEDEDEGEPYGLDEVPIWAALFDWGDFQNDTAEYWSQDPPYDHENSE